MFAVGLTGGIGSGKSTVADLLVDHGAVLIDADRIAREVVAPDGPAYQLVVDRFGASILAADGTIDRAALAALVFPHPEALAALNAITHPIIGTEMVNRRQELSATDAVVILDSPLLKPEHRELVGLDVVIVVDCPAEVSAQRLVEQRNFTPEDAAARMAAQPTRQERLVGADLVVDNSDDRAHLAAEVDRVWEELSRRAGRAAPGESPSR
jgi:dephospho-CoA kinase